MTRDERKRRMNISLMIDMRDRCEDIREKMEAKQSRWLERENRFPIPFLHSALEGPSRRISSPGRNPGVASGRI